MFTFLRPKNLLVGGFGIAALCSMLFVATSCNDDGEEEEETTTQTSEVADTNLYDYGNLVGTWGGDGTAIYTVSTDNITYTYAGGGGPGRPVFNPPIEYSISNEGYIERSNHGVVVGPLIKSDGTQSGYAAVLFFNLVKGSRVKIYKVGGITAFREPFVFTRHTESEVKSRTEEIPPESSDPQRRILTYPRQ